MEIREVFPTESHSRKGWLYVSKCSLNIFNNLLVSNICSYILYLHTCKHIYTYHLFSSVYTTYLYTCMQVTNQLAGVLSLLAPNMGWERRGLFKGSFQQLSYLLAFDSSQWWQQEGGGNSTAAILPHLQAFTNANRSFVDLGNTNFELRTAPGLQLPGE